MNTRMHILISAICTFAWLFGCGSDDVKNPEHRAAKNTLLNAWVATEPIQCLGNPWEQDWLENNNWEYDLYPKDPTTPDLEPEEFIIIQDYYARQGVSVFEGRNVLNEGEVCLACSCPEGQTLYLSVRDQDVATMISLGYRVESPPE